MNIFALASVWKFVCAHQVIATMVAGWMFSAYASQIVIEPTDHSTRIYRWWYSVVHAAAANIDRFKR